MQILGKNAWAWKDADSTQESAAGGQFAANGSFSDNLKYADREKDRGFIESIVSGNFHNQAESGVESALTCMLGRMAGQLGREVAWDELLQHGEIYHMDINMAQFR